jgi:hypothetical protein
VAKTEGDLRDGTPGQLAESMANQVEAVINLLYLIEHDRSDPDAVLSYIRMSDPVIRRLTELVRLSSVSVED